MSTKVTQWGVLCLVVAVFAALVWVPSLEAQVLYGSLVGTVVDQSGAVVPQAEVTIHNKATGQKRETTTDEAGRYTISNVLAGSYDLAVNAKGFRPFAQTGIDISINNVTRVDVQLEVGAVVETVTVQASAATLQTDKADVRVELGKVVLENLPLPKYRNFQSLINLVPGATPARFQNAITDTPARGLTTNINGTVRNTMNTRIDGATSVFTWLPHHVLYIPPAESIETVNVSTNAFDAEQGLAGGAAITVASKSGTNEFHGSAFEFYNNQVFQAKNFFNSDKRTPKNIQHQYGAALGGPIKKDKLFFFASWEGMKQRQNFARFATVPTADLRSGDFSGIISRGAGFIDCNQTPRAGCIYDPTTGDAQGRGRTAFPNNRIPVERQSRIARKIQDLLPAPNRTGSSTNLFASSPLVYDRDNVDVKVNWSISSRATMFGKYGLMESPVTSQGVLGEAIGGSAVSGSEAAGVGTGHNRTQIYGLGFTYTLTPRLLVDANFGGSRMHHDTQGPDFGKNIGSEVLGIPGTNGPDKRQSGFPIFDISGYETIGNPNNWSPVERNDRVYTYVANAAWTRGGHNIRFGMDLINHQMNHWQPELNSWSPRGRFNFRGGPTGLNGGAATNQFNAYAAFLLGEAQEIGKAIQFYDPMRTREWQEGYYFRDQWNVTRNFTATLGLRWEYFPIMHRGEFGIERYDAETNKVLIGGRGDVPRNAGTNTSKTMFAPRIGLAYRLGNATVIRTGYGISYDPYPLSRPLRSPFPAVVVAEFLGSGFQPIGKLDTGIPAFQTPDISSGVVALPLNFATRSLYPGDFRRGYIQSFNFFVERQVGAGFVAQVGYVGTRSIRQGVTAFNLNAGIIPGAGNNGRPLFLKFRRNATTGFYVPMATQTYDGLQARLDRRFSKGLFVTASYTWSKTMSTTNGNADDGWLIYIPSEMRRARAVAPFDRTHMFIGSTVYELPFGKGKRFVTGGPAGAILGGWQINGIFSSYTGQPFTVTAPGTSLNAPDNPQWADQVSPNVAKLGGVGVGQPFFDRSAYRAVTEVRMGTSARNGLRGPGQVNLDFSLFRVFRLTERFKLEFRAESYNLSNTPHFSNPNGDVSSPNFGFITSTAEQDQRNFKFALRLSF